MDLRTIAFLLLLTALPTAIAPATARGQSTTSDGRPEVLVAYYSQTGNTLAMAEAVAEGVEEVAGVRVTLEPVHEVTPAHMAEAAGLVLGSPTHWANLPVEVTAFVNQWPYLGDVVAGVFATAGNPGGGSEHVLLSLITALLNHGATIVGPVFEEEGGFRYGWMGAAALTGPVDPGVSEVELDGARRLGRRVAQEVARRHGARRP